MKAKQKQLAGLLAALAVLLAALAGVTLWNDRAAAASQAAAAGTVELPTLDPDAIDAIRYDYGGETVDLTKTADGWALRDDPEYHLSQALVQAMAEELGSITALRQVAPPGETDAADFGLDAPAMTVTAAAGEETLTLAFGSQNALTGDLYLTAGEDGAVYTVTSDRMAAFQYGKADLFDPASPVAVSVGQVQAVEYAYRGAAGSFDVALRRVSKADGTDESDTVWRLAGDETAALQQALVSAMLNQLTADVDGQLTSPGDAAAYGLDEPVLTVTLTETDGAVWQVTVGSGADGYYLAVEGDPSVYTVGDELPAAFAYGAADLLEQEEAAAGADGTTTAEASAAGAGTAAADEAAASAGQGAAAASTAP